jgi:hypothetical protein
MASTCIPMLCFNLIILTLSNCYTYKILKIYVRIPFPDLENILLGL